MTMSPIARAERNHQDRSTPHQRRRWIRWLDRSVMIAVYALAVILVANEILGLFLVTSGSGGENLAYTISRRIGVLTLLPLIVALTLHFRRMFQTLGLSANSIGREQQANNWDMLVLTGVDARSIVRGKWWATVQHSWRPYVMLGILRGLLVVWLGATTSRNDAYYNYSVASSYRLMVLPTLLQFVLAGTAIFVLTLANLLFTAACGVTAFNKRSGVALARVVATRLVIIIGICLTGVLLFRWWDLRANFDEDIVFGIAILSLVTLFDNGVIGSAELAEYRFSYDAAFYSTGTVQDFAVPFLTAVIVVLLVYALLTWLLLRLAQWQAVRHNALRPLPSNRQNPAKPVFESLPTEIWFQQGA